MPTFARVAPTIPITDVDRALRFYEQALGFRTAYTNGDPVSFVVIKQGAAELHLSVDPAKAGASHTHILVDDLDGVYEQLQQAGIAVRQPPQDQPWGLRDLIVADPDGNTFEIAQPINDRN